MKEPVQDPCPLCAASAEHYFVDYNVRKYYRCPNCGLFQITVKAELRLLQGPQAWRDNYAAMAKRAGEDEALVISCPSAPSRSEGAEAAIQAKFTPRSELPQG